MGEFNLQSSAIKTLLLYYKKTLEWHHHKSC